MAQRQQPRTEGVLPGPRFISVALTTQQDMHVSSKNWSPHQNIEKQYVKTKISQTNLINFAKASAYFHE